MSTEPLQWRKEVGPQGTRWIANADDGTYTVQAHRYAEGDWVCHWRETYCSTGAHLCRGGTPEEVKAVAESHRASLCRRLAWERYMAENDPPSAQVDVSRAIAEAIKDGPDLDAPVAKMYSTEEAMRILANDPPSNGEAL